MDDVNSKLGFDRCALGTAKSRTKYAEYDNCKFIRSHFVFSPFLNSAILGGNRDAWIFLSGFSWVLLKTNKHFARCRYNGSYTSITIFWINSGGGWVERICRDFVLADGTHQ
jgi:hypothetical protein